MPFHQMMGAKKNKDRINQKDKDKRKELREKQIIPYDKNPLFTKDTLEPYTVFQLKEIAKRFGMKFSPKLKNDLIKKILDTQTIQYQEYQEYQE